VDSVLCLNSASNTLSVVLSTHHTKMCIFINTEAQIAVCNRVNQIIEEYLRRHSHQTVEKQVILEN